MRYLLVLLSAILVSCSGKAYRYSEIIEVDPSGQAMPIKGQLIDTSTIAHAAHWPVKIGDTVFFVGRNGASVFRTIIAKEILDYDLALLTLGTPVDENNHFIAPVGKPQKDQPVTIFRHWGRGPLGTILSGTYTNEIFGWASKKDIISGDSGGAWYQLIDGKPHLVGTTHKAGRGGRSPNIHSILEAWRAAQ
jgi:hypothetical protein